MYLLIVSLLNGDVKYFGPFKTEDRSKTYAQACERDFDNYARSHIVPLISPFNPGSDL